MAFENRYSKLDRTLHQIAFNSYPFQVAVSTFEDRWFAKRLSTIDIKKPVFITALPRAGTTLLLEMCVALDEFASHSYRDMPFILTPMFWNYYSEKFQQQTSPQARAHNDGMLVDVDSPEAFEEVVWKSYWEQQYKEDRIIPWKNADDSEFSMFLRNHMRKIIALRANETDATHRYVSKNNLNIARIGLLHRLFPDAIIIVPFRQPLQHAASLLRQHLNFIEIHSHDKFARDYMAAIGHYDFGENLRPIDFDSWLGSSQYTDPLVLPFWVEYWTAAYRHLLEAAKDRIHFISYEALCENPEHGLRRMADIIDFKEHTAFLNQASRISAQKPHPIETGGMSSSLLNKMDVLYADLRKASIN
jgi:hypothetical protein